MALKSVLKFDCTKMLQNGQSVRLTMLSGFIKHALQDEVRQRYTDFVERLTDTRTQHPSTLIYCLLQVVRTSR